ncbi:MAG: SH3 domain-containing protein [Sphingomonadales bacterium]
MATPVHAQPVNSGSDAMPPAIVTGGSGLPVPRFVSLASNEIYMRAGPGRRYPIRWVYARRTLPVLVEAEFDIWRKVRDRDGETGWIHGSLLSGRRTVEIDAGEEDLHRKPHPGSPVVLRAEEGVIGELIGCEPRWCEVRVAGRTGWMDRSALWGVLPTD